MDLPMPGLSFLRQDFPHPVFELRRIVLDHIPNDFQVDAKVLMHDDISGSTIAGPVRRRL